MCGCMERTLFRCGDKCLTLEVEQTIKVEESCVVCETVCGGSSVTIEDGGRMDKNRLEVILDAEAVRTRVFAMGAEISRDYAAGRLLVIGVLKGAFVFMADLIRCIDVPLLIDFIQVSSYGRSSTSSGEITLRARPSLTVSGYDVLLVEDIVDSGLTVQWLIDYFVAQGANSVKVCALIDKAERRAHAVPIDYCGFNVPSGFLVGYGLDFNERFRNESAICHLHNPHPLQDD